MLVYLYGCGSMECGCVLSININNMVFVIFLSTSFSRLLHYWLENNLKLILVFLSFFFIQTQRNKYIEWISSFLSSVSLKATPLKRVCHAKNIKRKTAQQLEIFTQRKPRREDLSITSNGFLTVYSHSLLAERSDLNNGALKKKKLFSFPSFKKCLLFMGTV
jgi:hypothetical protein